MIRRISLAAMAVLAMAATANAGSIYTWLVIDPPTTAGAGVSLTNTFGVTSSRSGAGTYHLYAVDDADNSSGIRSYLVKVNNSTASNNRSPVTGYDTLTQDGPFTAGFNAPRTALNGGQDPGNPSQISGFGQTASNFFLKLPANTDPATFGSTTSGQWGIYALGDGATSGVLSDGHVRNAVLLGEGTYAAGSPPSIDGSTLIGAGGTAFNFWKPGFPNSGSETVSAGVASTTGQTLVIGNPFVPEPATLTLVGLAVVGLGGLAGRRRS